MRDTADADDRVPGKAAPLNCPVEDALEQPERAIHRRRAGAVDADLGAVAVDRLACDIAQPFAAEVGDDPLVEQRGVRGERARAEVGNGVGVPPLDEELLECGVRADYLGGELPKLTSAAQRGFEELGVAAAVEGSLAPGAPAAALVPAHDVGVAAVATPEPLDAHAGSNVVDLRRSRGRRSARGRSRRPEPQDSPSDASVARPGRLARRGRSGPRCRGGLRRAARARPGAAPCAGGHGVAERPRVLSGAQPHRGCSSPHRRLLPQAALELERAPKLAVRAEGSWWRRQPLGRVRGRAARSAPFRRV